MEHTKEDIEAATAYGEMIRCKRHNQYEKSGKMIDVKPSEAFLAGILHERGKSAPKRESTGLLDEVWFKNSNLIGIDVLSKSGLACLCKGRSYFKEGYTKYISESKFAEMEKENAKLKSQLEKARVALLNCSKTYSMFRGGGRTFDSVIKALKELEQHE